MDVKRKHKTYNDAFDYANQMGRVIEYDGMHHTFWYRGDEYALNTLNNKYVWLIK